MGWFAQHLKHDKKRRHTLDFSHGNFRGYNLRDFVCGIMRFVNVNGLWNFAMLDSRLPPEGILATPLYRDDALVST